MTPTVLAITGASGAIYSVRLLQQLVLADEIVELVVSHQVGQFSGKN